MSQFFNSEETSLHRHVENDEPLQRTNAEDVDFTYEIRKCSDWILKHGFQKVCLQFPDYLLPDSSKVASELSKLIESKVYVLADNTYESCCIDYITAQHVEADAIIHFGNTCFSENANTLPCLKVYEKKPVDIDALAEHRKQLEYPEVMVVVDTPYLHVIDSIATTLKSDTVVSIEENPCLQNKIVLYIGKNDRKLFNVYTVFNPNELYYFDPSIMQIENFTVDTRILKRRNFLVERIKDAVSLGIVIGTLAVKNYLKIVERVQALASAHKKKYYIISVGKPTVAKLANFSEIDIFVVIGCAMNKIYENRDFYKPIVTPYDVELALNYKPDLRFSYDYNALLMDDTIAEPMETDISLTTGKIRHIFTDDSSATSDLAVRSNGALDLYGARHLSERSWKGLEQNLGADEPQLATAGRYGIAQNYENEK